MGLFKIAGAALVIFASAMNGFAKNAAMKRSIACTEGFINGLSYLKEDMHFSMDYLDRALKNSASFAGSAKDFFENTAEDLSTNGRMEDAWENGLRAIADLNKDACATLCELGLVLGRTDCEMQKNQIGACVERLKSICEKQKSLQKSKGALYQKCSIAGGVLLVILLL